MGTLLIRCYLLHEFYLQAVSWHILFSEMDCCFTLICSCDDDEDDVQTWKIHGRLVMLRYECFVIDIMT